MGVPAQDEDVRRPPNTAKKKQEMRVLEIHGMVDHPFLAPLLCGFTGKDGVMAQKVLRIDGENHDR
jgi:hypothetical protein